jgi:hypothetical protein
LLAVVRGTFSLSTVLAAGTAFGGCEYSSAVVRFMPAHPGPSGVCYYVASSRECARRSVVGTPTLISPVWFSTYFPFYSSSYYQSTYVPADDQTEFQNDVSTFQSENESAIADDSSQGDWTDTDGNTWSGSTSDDPGASFDSTDDSGSSDDDGGDDDGGDDDGGDDDGGDDDGGDDDGGDDD